MSIACICYRICIQNGYIISKKKHYHNKFIYNLLCKDGEIHVILNCLQGGE